MDKETLQYIVDLAVKAEKLDVVLDTKNELIADLRQQRDAARDAIGPKLMPFNDFVAALTRRDLIPTIKAYKNITGLGLREAKRAVDQMFAGLDQK